ncbi:MAG: hypothetical protein N2D54_12070 [Chloroflexota bacterium]
MTNQIGRVIEIRLEAHGQTGALVECPSGMLPAAGQYLHAHALDEPDTVLPVSLFPSQIPSSTAEDKAQFITAPPIPPSWQPGTLLNLRGPLGHGFQLPDSTKHLALAVIGDTPSRLLPLIEAGNEIALFCQSVPSTLPLEVEVNPLSALPDALAWADFLAIDCPLDQLPALPILLGIDMHSSPPCPAQILVHAPMPCGALAECGVCAVPAKRGYKLACKDGPVFDWGEIAI